MPWRESSVEMERMKFILALLEDGESFAQICHRFGISRQTGYTWKRRFEAEGTRGLADRRPMARTHPNATDEGLADQMVDLRKKHPSWGPKKIRAVLVKQAPTAAWPAPSTIGAVLQRRGMVASRQPRLRVPPSPTERAQATSPNIVWTVHHKGSFDLINGRCYPLTLCDLASHYLLKCEALPSTSEAEARPHLEAAFREYGLPERIRSDNGTPFAASQAPGGLTHLSIWWIKLGISLERIALGHPEQNGAHERMHRTLKAEAITPGRSDMIEQQRAFDVFRRVYNLERPHEGLGQRIPADVYRRSWRPYPVELAELEYPEGMSRRQVGDAGSFSFAGERIFLTKLLAGETIGVQPRTDSRWDVYFGPVWVGQLYLQEKTWHLQSRQPTSVLPAQESVVERAGLVDARGGA